MHLQSSITQPSLTKLEYLTPKCRQKKMAMPADVQYIMFACGLAKCYAIFNTHSNRTLPSSSRLFFFVQTQQDGQKANKKRTSASLKRPAYNCHNHQPLTCTSPKNLDLSWYVSYMYQLMETASYPAQSHFQFLCSKMKVHNAVLNGCL